MFRYLPLLFLLGIAAGCSPPDSEPPPAAPAEQLLAGQAAYEKVCAHCHETGADGAPITGDRDAWADRSSLWAAVLEEHAKTGWLDMPAKGGDPTLADAEVAAAADYMLSITHPDQLTE
jgi:cytochrome c5